MSTGYLNALAYAKERVQGADLTESSNKAAPRVTITHHPDVVCSWLLLRGAQVALEKLSGDLPPAEKNFYEGKVAAAQFFAREVLPKLAAERAIAQRTDLALMDLDEAAF